MISISKPKLQSMAKAVLKIHLKGDIVSSLEVFIDETQDKLIRIMQAIRSSKRLKILVNLYGDIDCL